MKAQHESEKNEVCSDHLPLKASVRRIFSPPGSD